MRIACFIGSCLHLTKLEISFFMIVAHLLTFVKTIRVTSRFVIHLYAFPSAEAPKPETNAKSPTAGKVFKSIRLYFL